jgi:hypothetical protein
MLCVKLASDRAHPPHQELTNGNSQEVVPQEVRSQILEAVVEREEGLGPEKARCERAEVHAEVHAAVGGEEVAPHHAHLVRPEEGRSQEHPSQIHLAEALALPQEAVAGFAREARRADRGSAGGGRREAAR